MKQAVLVLEDGSVWRGVGFGAEAKVSGEVVFNTGMVGYVQSITDPSFAGQIVCQTYPLIGNYGVNLQECESDKPRIWGYVVSELCRHPSHYQSEMSLDAWLTKSGIPGIEGVDTRELTKTLRIKGTLLGILAVSREKIDEDSLRSELKEARDPNATDLVRTVSTEKILHYPVDGEPVGKVVLIDCGVKLNIVRSLQQRGLTVIRVPAKTRSEEILALEPDGILISNGPGDPKMADYAVQSVRSLIREEIPMLGICLGNQILGLALGCDTFKLKFGHRGQNHPVTDLESGRSYITSQNHGFAVLTESVAGSPLHETFRNCNDGTVEGMSHRELPLMGVQFHPEAAPGPNDTAFLFDRFVRMMNKKEK